MLKLGMMCHGSELAGWGAHLQEGLPPYGPSIQSLLSPSPPSGQSQMLRVPGSLKLKSVSMTGKCGQMTVVCQTQKELCCTEKS